VKQADEKGEHQMPEEAVHEAMVLFARERGALAAHAKGSLPRYVAPALALAYNLRLRGIELTDLTDAHGTEEAVLCNRRKGSRANLTRWNDDLRQAWAELQAYRSARWKAHRREEPRRPEERFLLVDEAGMPLRRDALRQAMARLKELALEAGVLKPGQKFGLHGLKHRGITDTEGNIGDKQEAAGHVERKMTQRYAHDLPVVAPPKRAGIAPDFPADFPAGNKKGT
jgi:hypothetical protein